MPLCDVCVMRSFHHCPVLCFAVTAMLSLPMRVSLCACARSTINLVTSFLTSSNTLWDGMAKPERSVLLHFPSVVDF